MMINLKKVQAKMTPCVELILTIFLGFTGIRWFIRGKYGIGLRLLLTFGLFGIGWLVDIISCIVQCCQASSKRKLQGYTVVDSSYPFEENTCLWHIQGYAWLEDIGNIVIRNEYIKINNIYEDFTSCTGDETYRRRLYFCKDEIVCTNMEGLDFKYTYDEVKNIDIYNDAIVISDTKNRIQTVRLNNINSEVYSVVKSIFKMRGESVNG